jgi:DNA-binding NarL/FixJ family response regulator
MHPVKILVVDEQSAIRAGIRSMLTKHQDVEVVGEATCIQEALYAVRAIRPDMVLLEVLMPYLNEYETTLHISAMEASFLIKQIDPGIRLIVFTTHAHPDIIKSLIRGGVSAVVLKQDSVADLYMAIQVVRRGGIYFSRNARVCLSDGGGAAVLRRKIREKPHIHLVAERSEIDRRQRDRRKEERRAKGTRNESSTTGFSGRRVGMDRRKTERRQGERRASFSTFL